MLFQGNVFKKVNYKNTIIKSVATGLWLYCFNAFSNPINVDISYVKLAQQKSSTLSIILQQPDNSGLSGAKLAISDSNTTGKFLQQHFHLNYILAKQASQFLTQIENEYQQGKRIFIIDAPLIQLMQVNTWAEDKAVLLFNVNESTNEIRRSQCLSSVFHIIPSNAMKSDALAQWLLYRRMNKILVISGIEAEDLQLVNSFKRSVKRFGLKIVEEKQWSFNTDLRRAAQQEIPLFTQTVKDYDVIYVADKRKNFAELIPFNTYLPRPVIGSAGLEALAWHGAIEQWGATQLQNRFIKQHKRHMNEIDFAGYLAVRSIAQTVHKLHSNESKKIKEYIKSDAFELAAYKGRKLSFRPWSQQLRMPIALVQPHSLVSQSPQPGMLHPKTELDTLGFDAQESQCK